MDSFLNNLSTFFRHVMDVVHGPMMLLIVLWSGSVVLTVALLVMMYSRWGQIGTFPRFAWCLGLSLFAHGLMAGYITQIPVGPMVADFQEQVIHVSLNEKPASMKSAEPGGDMVPGGKSEAGMAPGPRDVKPWEAVSDAPVLPSTGDDLARAAVNDAMQPQRVVRNDKTGLPGGGSLDELPLAEATAPQPEGLRPGMSVPQPGGAKSAETIDAPKAMRREGVRTEIRDQANVRPGVPSAGSGQPVARVARAGSPQSMIDRTAPLPTLKDVKPTTSGLGPPADTLTGVADVQPRHGAGNVAGPINPDLPSGGGSDAGEPGGTGMPGPSADNVAGPSAAPDEPVRVASIAGRNDGYAGIGGVPGLVGVGGTGGGPSSGIGPAVLPPRRGGSGDRDIPGIYKGRVSPDRSRLAQEQGATQETERSVRAALKFLASNQEADGHWDARLHEGGRELKIAGRDRQGAGGRANTGMTGLALLAFLASNNTHLNGDYTDNVRRGLEYLMRSQRRDGALGGDGNVYEFMYTHAMAAFALGEAYGMTNDERLEKSVRRGVEFTLSMQNKSSGGWRYTTGDNGDTSQLGWQLMALKSADLAGVHMPDESRQGVLRFLNSVSYGNYGGLAAYRASEQPTRTMTAEALVCRQFLGLSPDTPKAREAAESLLADMPGQGRTNLYYWYYGTLAMHQMQGVYWERWNAAMQRTLINTQQRSGPQAGSWDPDDLWGTYGGRLYSTALSTLCLEVYYRFLPLYIHKTGREGTGE